MEVHCGEQSAAQQQPYVQAMQHAPPWPSASSSAGWQGTIVLVQPPAQPPWHWSTNQVRVCVERQGSARMRDAAAGRFGEDM